MMDIGDIDIADLGLGRLTSPDSRDNNFLARELFQAELIARKYRGWSAHISSLYQASRPHCVAFSWMHFLVDAPMTHKVIVSEPGLAEMVIRGTQNSIATDEFYKACQMIDEWPGEDYDGTSVRAGAKVLQKMGLISEYRWAFTLQDMINCVLEQGPVIVGTNWYRGMSIPGKNFFIAPDGPLDGGHAYKVDGVNVPAKRFRIKNSWSSSWGNRGFAYMTFANMERLLNEDGEACIALEA